MHRFDLGFESSRDRPPAKGNASSYAMTSEKSGDKWCLETWVYKHIMSQD